MSQWLTVAEVAELLRLNPQTVYKLIREGELPALRLGRTIRVRAGALEDYRAEPEPAEGEDPRPPRPRPNRGRFAQRARAGTL
jgi:excisionase family DNA binding protein